jgi:D-3-phosphoglycerate dehydrogenase
VLGDADVNIAGMQVSRRQAGGEALMVLTVDSAIPAEALADIAQRIGATSPRSVDLSTE